MSHYNDNTKSPARASPKRAQAGAKGEGDQLLGSVSPSENRNIKMYGSDGEYGFALKLGEQSIIDEEMSSVCQYVHDYIINSDELPRDKPIELSLIKNEIGNVGARVLAAMLHELIGRRRVRVSKLYIYMNSIGSEGATALSKLTAYDCLFELHLSHNQITNSGALEIMRCIDERSDERTKGVWLRLEFNFLRPAEFLAAVRDMDGHYCIPEKRPEDGTYDDTCKPSRCNNHPHGFGRFAHLPHIHSQCEAFFESEVLLEAAQHKGPDAETLFIFLDTNVVEMFIAKKFFQECFKRFPAADVPGERVKFVISDTVRGELDGLGDRRRKLGDTALGNAIKDFMTTVLVHHKEHVLVLKGSEGQLFMEDAAAGVLSPGGAHTSVNSAKDRVIIDLVAHWNAQVKVLFLTNDRASRMTAKRHGIASATAADLMDIPRTRALWSADIIRSALPMAYHDEEKNAPICAPVLSKRTILDELEHAADTVEAQGNTIEALTRRIQELELAGAGAGGAASPSRGGTAGEASASTTPATTSALAVRGGAGAGVSAAASPAVDVDRWRRITRDQAVGPRK